MKEKFKTTKQRGITLIALVITIIVLLILAGVSIAMLTGQNGILTQAQNANIQQSHGAVRDSIALLYNEYQIEINTGNTTKLASTETVTIPAQEEKALANNSMTFLEFLQGQNSQGINYFKEGNILNVETLTGSKQSLGNGEGTTDVYILSEQDGNYVVNYYDNNQISVEIWSSTGEIADNINWDEVFANAQPPEDQVESSDIGVDSNGNPVNMDNWAENVVIGDNEGISLINVEFYGSNNTPVYESAYSADKIVEGKIIEEIPKYIKKVGSDKFLPVTSLDHTFYELTNLVEAPEIPDTVTDMNYAFYGCTSLTQVPEIPDSVTNMTNTFSGCTSLTQVPEIPDSVTNMDSTFYGCTSLAQAPEIPDSVTDMGSTFYECSSLTQAPEIPSSVTSLYYTFSGCIGLTEAPEIPSSVTSLNSTFSGCIGLTEAPEIPSSVTFMLSTFSGCTNLKEAPVIPENVENLQYTFKNCINLTGNLIINTQALNLTNGCLTGTATNNGCNLVLSGSCPDLRAIYNTKSSNSHITLE